MITRNEGERSSIDFAVSAVLSAHENNAEITEQLLEQGFVAVQKSRRLERAEQINHYEMLRHAIMGHHFPKPGESEKRKRLEGEALHQVGGFVPITQEHRLLHALASEYLARGNDSPWQAISARMKGDIGELLRLPLTELVIRHINGEPRQEESVRFFRYSPAVA